MSNSVKDYGPKGKITVICHDWHQSGRDIAPAANYLLDIRTGSGRLHSNAQTDSGLPPTADTKPRLRIVEVVDSMGSGGAQVLMAHRAKFADQLGYHIDIISLGEGTASLPDFESRNITVHILSSPHVFKLSRLWEICRLLRRLKPDLVHTHLRSSNIVGTLCARLCGVPVISTLHNVFPEADLAHARRDWAEKWVLRLLCNLITAVGPTVARAHQARFGQKEITVIANPVDDLSAEQLDKQTLRQSLDVPLDIIDKPLVFVAARLTQIKGFPQSLQVINKVRESIPDVRLLVAGDGPLLSELQNYVEEHDLQSHIALLGRSEQVSELMLASDVFLLTSSGEGLPLVLLEAMIRRLPAVATKVGDVPWALGDGEAGELVDWNDIDTTAARVVALISDPDYHSKVAAAAHKRATDHFSLRGWLREVDNTYCKVTGAKQPLTANFSSLD